MIKNIVSQKISTLRNSAAVFYIATEMLVKAVPFLAIPLLTRMLTKEEMGLYFLFISIAAIFSKLFGFAFPFSVTSFYIKYPRQIHTYMFNILFISALLYAIVSLFVQFLNIELINEEFDKILLFVSLCLAVTEIFLSYLVISRRYTLHNLLYLIKFALPYITAVFIIFFFQHKALWFAYCQGGVALLLALYMVVYIIKMSEFKINKSMLKFGLLVSAPLLPVTISSYLLNVADRYMIKYYYSEVEVAEYSFAYAIAGIFTTFILATNRSWQPFMLEQLKKNNIRAISVKFIKYAIFMAGLAIFIWIVRKPAIMILAGEKYISSASMIAPILIGNYCYFLYTVTSNVPFFHKKMILYALPATIAAILNIILNYYMLPTYGYKIAAYTTLISFAVEIVIAHAITRYVFRFKFF